MIDFGLIFTCSITLYFRIFIWWWGPTIRFVLFHFMEQITYYYNFFPNRLKLIVAIENMKRCHCYFLKKHLDCSKTPQQHNWTAAWIYSSPIKDLISVKSISMMSEYFDEVFSTSSNISTNFPIFHYYGLQPLLTFCKLWKIAREVISALACTMDHYPDDIGWGRCSSTCNMLVCVSRSTKLFICTEIYECAVFLIWHYIIIVFISAVKQCLEQLDFWGICTISSFWF